MKHRPPKLPLASRIIAVGCAMLWLVAVSACNLKALCCCDSHDSETEPHANQEHSHGIQEAAAVTPHAHDTDNQDLPGADGCSHDNPENDCKEGSCCSTLCAVTHKANPIVLSEPANPPIPLLCVLLEAHASSHTFPDNPNNRHAKSYDRIFTPEVRLGPAHRSLAPPAFCVI